ncbi:MAG: GNAT family N-acetyltransferase [Candidatus Pacearchaeota archaeon]|jgi:ribosomal protein S18 acetylase RimI-like enzyme
MKIRKATKLDSEKFVRLQKEEFPNLNSMLQKKYFMKKIKEGTLLILEDKKNYIGHISFGVYKSPPFGHGIFLEEFAIKKEFQGKGLGSYLLKEIEKYCKNKRIDIIYLGTEDSNKNKAINFYKKQGYQVVGRLKDINPSSEYKHGQIFMAKVIK